MIPSTRLFFLFAVPFLPIVMGALPGGSALLTELGLLLNVLLLGTAALDLFVTPRARRIRISRHVSEVLSVGARNPVELRLLNQSKTSLELEVSDEPPEPGVTEGLPLRLSLPPWKERAALYHFEPQRRGHSRFANVHLRYRSFLGLWTIQDRRRLNFAVRIYPDISAVRRYDLLACRNRLQETGFKLWRLRGRGGDFERLREYRREDEVRDIDWKATAKHRRLISREFTIDRNQNVFILLDCGRSMLNETEGISHLDRGLNAAVILSYIALSQGDNVGLMAFSNRVERYVRPVRGKPAVQTLLQQTFDLYPRRVASDYGMACEEVMRRQRKRALVILVTHTLDEQHVVSIRSYISSLTASHLLLLVFLRDISLANLANTVPGDDVEAFHTAAAGELLATQAQEMAELRESGSLVLETLPTQLSSHLINQYLDLKARHLL